MKIFSSKIINSCTPLLYEKTPLMGLYSCMISGGERAYLETLFGLYLSDYGTSAYTLVLLLSDEIIKFVL